MSVKLKENCSFFSPSYFENKILQVIELAPKIFRIRFENSIMACFSQPGQFINIKISDNYIPLWRRPFSIHNVNSDRGWVDILFRVVGKGTKLLSQKKKGERLNFIGPLGKSFEFSNDEIKTALIVAGGLGIAPLVLLCYVFVEKGITPILFWGAKTASEFCCIKDFKKLDIKTHLATEDGSAGYRGLVTDLVDSKIEEFINTQQTTLFACGPNPMLNQLSLTIKDNKLPCQVSLETLMACGLGACLGCGVKANNPEIKYLYVCKDGPVFDLREIDLSE